MNKIRIEYAKTGPAKFLSHLDLLRSFSRALRRTHLPIAYTEGYNPHLKIYPGPALATGIEGLHEYLDLETAEQISPREFKDSLKNQLIEGLFLRRAELLPPLTKGLSKTINCSWYRLIFFNEDPLHNIISAWEEEVAWPYQRARDGKIFDLKTGINELRTVSQKGFFFIDLLLKSGTGEVPLKGLMEFAGKPEITKRVGLFQQREPNKLINPFQEETVLWDETFTEEEVRY